MIDRTVPSSILVSCWHVGWMSMLLVALVHGQGLGRISAVYESTLPYYSEAGEHLGVLEDVESDVLVGQNVLGKAPRGLILLTYDGESRWFRSVHFEIGGGPAIVCPEMLVGQDTSTRKPVTHNMEGACVAPK